MKLSDAHKVKQTVTARISPKSFEGIAPGSKAEQPQVKDGYTPSETPADSGTVQSSQESSSPSIPPGFESVSFTATASFLPPLVAAPVLALKDAFTGGVRESAFQHRAVHESEESAQESFQAAKKKLLNPNSWKSLGPKLGAANFELYDGKSAEPREGEPRRGDYLKIKLPDGLGPTWVEIEKLEQREDSAKLVVRPSADPAEKKNPTVLHLFDESTTNVFSIKREGNEVVASVEGNQETANTDGNLLQRKLAKARTAGAWMGAKKPQWNAFTKNLLTGAEEQSPLATTGLSTAFRVAEEALG